MSPFLKFVGLVMLMVSVTSTTAIAQKKIPESVKKSFAKKYPGIKEVHWEMEDGNFEGQFKQDGSEYTAVYTVEGDWVETEQKLRPRDLPKDIATAAKENYSSYSISEAEHVESALEGSFYELKLKKGTGVLELKIFPDGKMSVEELETVDDDD